MSSSGLCVFSRVTVETKVSWLFLRHSFVRGLIDIDKIERRDYVVRFCRQKHCQLIDILQHEDLRIARPSLTRGHWEHRY